jgi:RNA polymerase sigma-70 factor (ECF subfamily)
LTIPSDFSLRFPLPAAVEASRDITASRLEEQVVVLFDELRDRLLRYLLCLGVPMHDGEEIVQESFLLLFKHLQGGKSQQNLRGWLFRVARNLAFRFHRDNRVTHAVPIDENLLGLKEPAENNPEQNLHNQQRQKSLLAVVRALPEQDQVCLFLRADGMRYREIGTTLGMSLGSVATSLARSLAKLARADGGSL